jgi:molybdopterin synthase sulfur carrier subunit
MARIRLFGAFQDMAGWADRQIEADTLGAAIDAVAAGTPSLADRLRHRSPLVILNETLTPLGRRDDALALAPGDELAFGPPVSGG